MKGRRVAATMAWAGVVAVSAFALHRAGGGLPAGPPLTAPGRWAGWLESRDPVLAAFSLLRLAALGGLWYLALVTVLGAGARVAGAASLVRVTDRVTIGPVRRMLAGCVSLGLATSGVLAVAAPALRAPLAAQTSTTSTTSVPPATVTMHRLGPAEAATPVAQVPVPPPAADRWTVKPGDCFWSIAESVLTERWGRAPADAEIVPYWKRLIEANRGELVHRDNPDLVLPAQVFVVPAP